ncbi:hypothetical protein ABZS79_09660 [Streptomyces griseoloalbus]|uniref:hypothetical protein n=1 Tax=Streptomyces griseoloalbus TaxID=67303 RepID=UPI0033BAB43B
MVKKKRRPAGSYQIPPHIREAQRSAAERRGWKPRPLIPRPREIVGVAGVSLLCVCLSLAFWLPSRALVHDLRHRGVTVAATVTGVDNKPKYVRVRFIQGSKSGTEVKLWDYAGMLPDVHRGDPMLVTYDPEAPSRSLSYTWVIDPPFNLPACASAVGAVVFSAGAVAGTLRRRHILRTPWPPDPFAPDLGVSRSSPPGSA